MMQTYDVLLSDTLVGHIQKQDRGQIVFRFTEEYERMAHRPVLGQFFEDDLRKTYTGKGNALPPFFANLVPEGPLRNIIERSLHIPTGDDLAFLSAVGSDLPGAVEIRVSDAALTDMEREDIGEENDQERLSPSNGAMFRFSLAGVQLKFSALAQSDKVTLPAHGELGDWIVKLDSARFPRLVENEFAIMNWAKAAAFTVPECRIIAQDALPSEIRMLAPAGSNVYIIRRYDRTDARRVHQEDFAQVLGLRPEMKYARVTYEQLAFLVQRIVGQEAYFEFVRRLVFMIASGNTDAHTKNGSFYYPDGVTAQLAPLYDQVAVVAWPDVPFAWALKFAGTNDPYDTDEGRFERLAFIAQMDKNETLHVVRDAVEQIASAWSVSAAPQIMPGEHVRLLPATRCRSSDCHAPFDGVTGCPITRTLWRIISPLTKYPALERGGPES